MLAVRVDGAGDEAGLGAEGERDGVERVVERSLGAGLGDLALLGGGGVLALGEAVDPVVEQQDLQVDVAAQGVDEVVAADAQGVAVAGDDPHGQVRAGDGEAGGDGRGAAVDGVHAVGVHVVREARRAADAGDEDDVLAAQAELGQEALDGGEDRVVAAAGAPADLLVGLEVLGGERRVGLGDQAEGGDRVGHLGPHRLSMAAVMAADQLGGLEGHAAHLVDAHDVDEVLRAQQHAELAEVHLRDEDLVVRAQDLAEVGGERVEVAQMCLRDHDAGAPGDLAGRTDRARRSSPSRARGRGPRRSGSSTASGPMLSAMRIDLGLAQVHHPVVVLGVVGDGAGPVGLLQPADAVLEPGRAGHGPRSGEGLLVAQVGPELVGAVGRHVVRRGGEVRVDRRAAVTASGTSQGSEPFAR